MDPLQKAPDVHRESPFTPAESEGDSGPGSTFEKDSLSLTAAVAMGTGVMIGPGIFATTGQVAEQGGRWFPIAFVGAAIISAFGVGAGKHRARRRTGASLRRASCAPSEPLE